MNRILIVLFAILTSVVIYSCKSDTVVTSGDASNLNGTWTVDKVQLVSAPTSGTANAMMKAALVPFGEMTASTVGNLDFTFNSESMVSQNTNLGQNDFQKIFFGNTGYYYNPFTFTLLLTTDGGITWNEKSLPTSRLSLGLPISILSSTTLYYTDGLSNFLSPNLKLYKSTDAGSSWSLVNPRLNFSPMYSGINTSLSFANENTGFALGQDSLYQFNIYKTTNGGVNWTKLPQSGLHFNSLTFYDELNGRGQMDDGQGIYFSKTSDGGITWTDYRIPNYQTDFITGYYFINASIGYANVSGNNGNNIFYKTLNGGETWNKVSDSRIYSCVFKNENEGFGLMPGQMMLKTTDGGQNWTAYNNELNAEPVEIYLINNAPVFFDRTGKIFKSAGYTNSKWTAKGKLTSSIIKAITGGEDYDIYAYGDYSANADNISFHVVNYSNFGARDVTGSGTFGFNGSTLGIQLFLANGESWKIKLSRRY